MESWGYENLNVNLALQLHGADFGELEGFENVVLLASVGHMRFVDEGRLVSAFCWLLV